MINSLLQGNSLEHLTKFMEIVIEKYDQFVKELHVSFISYVETLYDNLVQTMQLYWNRVLQNIEPQIIRSIHYIESILWGISTEIFDFMYNRTNELIGKSHLLLYVSLNIIFFKFWTYFRVTILF